jgi:hypothetical protein
MPMQSFDGKAVWKGCETVETSIATPATLAGSIYVDCRYATVFARNMNKCARTQPEEYVHVFTYPCTRSDRRHKIVDTPIATVL